MMDDLVTERVYVDPQRLMQLKKQRKPLKMVPSVFEPPRQPPTEASVSQARPSDQQGTALEADEVLSEANRSPNAEFIVSLLSGMGVTRQSVMQLQEGDALDLGLQDRWLVLDGEVRVIGINSHSYTMGSGYFFFVCTGSRTKVKEVLGLKTTTLLKVGPQLYHNYLKNFIFLKNSQKIKYLKYCPFFLWGQELSEDLAGCMTMMISEKQRMIYHTGQPSDYIYFVKEGIVLLERSHALRNKVVADYELHYEKTHSHQEEATLIVKKGMVFGIDGVLLSDSLGQVNPETASQGKKRRIYNATCLGRTQMYAIHKEVLETLFNVMDLANWKEFPRELTKGDLDRICNDYAEMVVRHKSLPKISKQAIQRRELIAPQTSPSAELVQKRSHAAKVRLQEEIAKKLSIAHAVPQRKPRQSNIPVAEQNSSLANQLTQKLAQADTNHPAEPLTFPQLGSSLRKKRSKQKQEREATQKYIMRWLGPSDPNRAKKSSSESAKKSPLVLKKNASKERLSLFNVKSYRSIAALRSDA